MHPSDSVSLNFGNSTTDLCVTKQESKIRSLSKRIDLEFYVSKSPQVPLVLETDLVKDKCLELKVDGSNVGIEAKRSSRVSA